MGRQVGHEYVVSDARSGRSGATALCVWQIVGREQAYIERIELNPRLCSESTKSK